MSDAELLSIVNGGGGGARSAADLSDDELLKLAGVEKPKPIGKDANADFLKAELEAADPFTRNLAAFGTAASNTWEGLKQWFGKKDKERVQLNRVIADSAPLSAFAGEVAETAIPILGLAGNTVKGAMKVGAVLGATRPVEGEGLEMLGNKAASIGLESALSGAGQWGANWAGKKMAEKISDLATSKVANSERDATLRKARESGMVAPPTAVDPTGWNALRESFSGKIATAQAASNKNAPVIDRMIRGELALPDNVPITGDVLQKARDRAYAIGYKPIADAPAINWDPSFDDALKALSPRGAGGAVQSPAQGEIDALLSTLAGRGQWTGQQLIHDIRVLRQQASANFKAWNDIGKQDLARVQIGAADALEELAAKNIGDPNAAELFRQARRYIAKTHDVEDAIIEGSGSVDARKFGSMFQSNPDKMTGNLRTIGAFANNFKNAVQPAAKVQGPNVSALSPALGAFLGGASYSAGGDTSSVAMAAALPFASRYAMRKYLLSDRAQSNALRRMYELGLIPRTAGRLSQYAPVGLAVGGTNALLE